MGRAGLLLLRISLGFLMVFWGLDKLVNVEHGVRVAEAFYLGVGANALFLNAFGVAQIALGALVVLGLWRRYAYPVLFAICLVTALGVWRSIVDPWGWVFEDSNVLFYPSLVILAGSMTVWGLRERDELCLDARRSG